MERQVGGLTQLFNIIWPNLPTFVLVLKQVCFQDGHFMQTSTRLTCRHICFAHQRLPNIGPLGMTQHQGRASLGIPIAILPQPKKQSIIQNIRAEIDEEKGLFHNLNTSVWRSRSNGKPQHGCCNLHCRKCSFSLLFLQASQLLLSRVRSCECPHPLNTVGSQGGTHALNCFTLTISFFFFFIQNTNKCLHRELAEKQMRMLHYFGWFL